MRWLLILALALSVTACGGDSNDDATTDESRPTNAVQVETTGTADAEATESEDEAEPTATEASGGAVATSRPASSTPTDPQTTPPPLSDEARDLDSLLLTLDDMPAGWTMSPIGDLGGDSIVCDAPSITDVFGEFPEAEVRFEAGELGPLIHESISQFTDKIAEEVLAHLRDNADCGEWVDDDTTWQISGMSFPDLGDECLAYRMTTESDGFTILIDAVFVRAGDLILYVAHLGVNQVDSDLTVEMVEKALDKLDE